MTAFAGHAERLLSWEFFTTLLHVLRLSGAAFLRSEKLVLACILASIILLLGASVTVNY